ncbi:MAG: glycosyltransferase family 2 protein [Planctomycetota bacterium]|nr:MAG: glycosyltransferase family 2 protein [Planctomycetota bacterium]
MTAPADPSEPGALFVVVPTVFAAPDALAECLAGLRAQATPHRVLCVADGRPPPPGLRAEHPAVEWLELPCNLGFCGAANAGLRRALADGADLCLLLNDDAAPEPGCLAALVRAAESAPDAGIFAPLLLSPAGDRAAGLGIEINLLGSGRDRAAGLAPQAAASLEAQVLAATGGALLVRRTVLEAVGLFDEGYRFYYEDVDLCLAARDAGFEILSVPAARVRHRHSASLGRDSPRKAYYLSRNQVRLVAKTFPWPHLAYALPLSLARLGVRVVASLSRGELRTAAAQVRAAASLARGVPRLLARRRPMRPETFALVRRCLRWGEEIGPRC